MALVLKQIFVTGSDEIAQNYAIESWHVSQSVDAFTGAAAYDITISGSLTLTGSVDSKNGFTGSLKGIAATSSKTIQVEVSNSNSSNQFLVLFTADNASGYPRYSGLLVDSGSDFSGLRYQPSTNALSASLFVGTASVAVSSSYSDTSSVADYANNINYSYIAIDDVTYSSSAAPYPVGTTTPSQVYISQSGVPSTNHLSLQFGVGNDGQIVNFTPYFLQNNFTLNQIEITASGTIVKGLGGSIIPNGSSNTANNLWALMTPTSNNLIFQYVATNTGILTAGWYLINANTQ